jgi:hypothetical protein
MLFDSTRDLFEHLYRKFLLSVNLKKIIFSQFSLKKLQFFFGRQKKKEKIGTIFCPKGGLGQDPHGF